MQQDRAEYRSEGDVRVTALQAELEQLARKYPGFVFSAQAVGSNELIAASGGDACGQADVQHQAGPSASVQAVLPRAALHRQSSTPRQEESDGCNVQIAQQLVTAELSHANTSCRPEGRSCILMTCTLSMHIGLQQAHDNDLLCGLRSASTLGCQPVCSGCQAWGSHGYCMQSDAVLCCP
jgi:hypothetical protein